MNEPKIFVASSSEGIKYARALVDNFEHDNFIIKPWYFAFDNNPLITTTEQLNKLKEFDFGIIIFTPDDKTTSRGEIKYSPRDNLVYELGLLVGFIGRERVFLLKPRDEELKIPSDLLGTNPLDFQSNVDDLRIALQYPSNRIRENVTKLGSLPIKQGEIAQGLRSNILIHPNISYDDGKLRFRIAYRGQGTLINVKIHIYYLHLYPKEGFSEYGRSWYVILEEDTPEISACWNLKVDLTKSEKLGEFIDFSDLSIESYKNISGGIGIFVSGFDSLNYTHQFNKVIYKPSDITDYIFKDFYKMNKNGEVVTIEWDDFEKITKANIV